MDNGTTVDVRLITEQGRCYTTKPELQCYKPLVSRIDTPSPTFSSSSSSSICNTTNGDLITLHQTSNAGTLVKKEHTYFCNLEMKEQMQDAENSLTARIILRSNKNKFSLRRFLNNDSEIGKNNHQFFYQ